jgi:membrane protein required for colicin V production
MNTLDIIVLAVIGLSGLFAFARGFVKEVFSIGAWVGAGLIALYAFPHVRPIARSLIAAPAIADGAAAISVFLVSVIVLSLLASAIAGRVKGSALSALDRTLGLVFGLARGIAIACVAWIAASWALPEKDWPDWARGARTRPFLMSGADTLRSLVPGQARERGAATAAEAQRVYEQAREADRLMRALSAPVSGTPVPAAAVGGAKALAPAPSGYNPSARKDMDRLFENTQ